MSEKFCGDCDFNRNGLCIVHRWDVSEESPICSIFRKTYPGTVFQKITASPEVLGEKLVYDWGHLCYNGDIKIYWKSTILPDAVFGSKAEALSATVAKLKEVVE